MTASKHITIWCDFTDCVEWTDHGESTAEETRRLVRLEGWVRRRVGMGYQDLCREHRGITEDTTHIPDERPGSLDAPWMEEPDPLGITEDTG